MKKLFVIALSVFVTMAFVTPCIAKVYTITNQEDGSAAASTADAPPFGDAGVEGWTVQTLSGSGVDFFVFKIAPDAASMAAHESPDAWIGYVEEGQGELTLTDKEGRVKSSIEYKEGDIFVFDADTMHGWNASSVETILVFVRTAQK